MRKLVVGILLLCFSGLIYAAPPSKDMGTTPIAWKGIGALQESPVCRFDLPALSSGSAYLVHGLSVTTLLEDTGSFLSIQSARFNFVRPLDHFPRNEIYSGSNLELLIPDAPPNQVLLVFPNQTGGAVTEQDCNNSTVYIVYDEIPVVLN
ncbi:MAG: hypothetical protein ACWGMT_06495 [Burkholderiales bacterium]